MIGGFPKPEQPGNDPQKAKTTRYQKCRAPSKTERQRRNGQRGDNDAHVGTAVEYTRREGSFLLRKPVGDSSYGGWEIRRFACTQRETRHRERPETRCECVASRCKTPHHNRDGVSQTRADSVDDAARNGHDQRIGELKPEHDPAVIGLIPAKLGLQRWLENAEDLAIDVIDGGCEKQKTADQPADIAC